MTKYTSSPNSPSESRDLPDPPPIPKELQPTLFDTPETAADKEAVLALRARSCCFTGHRVLSAEEREKAVSGLENCTEKLYSIGIRRFYIGGAVGFDTLAWEAVLALRERRPDVKVIAVLPCRDFAAKWSAEDRLKAAALLEQSSEIIFTEEHYSPSCMHKRNRYMVDHSAVCVSFYRGGKGGTKNTEEYARRRGLELINLCEFSVH